MEEGGALGCLPFGLQPSTIEPFGLIRPDKQDRPNKPKEPNRPDRSVTPNPGDDETDDDCQDGN